MFEPSLDVGPGTARLFVSQYVSVSDLLHTRALHQLETDDERVSVCGPPVEQGCDTCSLEGVGKRAGDGTRGFPQYSTVRAAAWPANKVAFSLGGRSDFVFGERSVLASVLTGAPFRVPGCFRGRLGWGFPIKLPLACMYDAAGQSTCRVWPVRELGRGTEG